VSRAISKQISIDMQRKSSSPFVIAQHVSAASSESRFHVSVPTETSRLAAIHHAQRLSQNTPVISQRSSSPQRIACHSLRPVFRTNNLSIKGRCVPSHDVRVSITRGSHHKHLSPPNKRLQNDRQQSVACGPRAASGAAASEPRRYAF
jgi:hypothetical protein